MSEEELQSSKRVSDEINGYQSPAIEEVVSRESLEREVAYAGIIGGSNSPN